MRIWRLFYCFLFHIFFGWIAIKLNANVLTEFLLVKYRPDENISFKIESKRTIAFSAKIAYICLKMEILIKNWNPLYFSFSLLMCISSNMSITIFFKKSVLPLPIDLNHTRMATEKILIFFFFFWDKKRKCICILQLNWLGISDSKTNYENKGILPNLTTATKNWNTTTNLADATLPVVETKISDCLRGYRFRYFFLYHILLVNKLESFQQHHIFTFISISSQKHRRTKTLIAFIWECWALFHESYHCLEQMQVMYFKF